MKGQNKYSGKTHASGSNVDDPKKNLFYALSLRSEQESSPDVMTSMLLVLSIVVYTLPDPGATLYFVTPLISRKFDIFLDILNEPFMVTAPVCDLFVAKRVYRNSPILLPIE